MKFIKNKSILQTFSHCSTRVQAEQKKSKWKKLSRTRGFTLIELLVVISIIGFLSSVVLASTQTAREKAQISKFTQEMRQVQNALELYYLGNNQYPQIFSPISGVISGYLSSYIKSINQPLFLNPSAPWQYYTKGISPWAANYTCGNVVAPEYFIRFESNIPLPSPFATLYLSGVQQTGTSPYDHLYCISSTK